MSTTKKFLLCNIGFIAMFLAAYTFNRNMMIVAALIPSVFIIMNPSLSFGVAEALFLLPFSATMTISVGTTSLFMLPKLALIAAFILRRKMKVSAKVVLVLAFLLVYALVINIFKGEMPLVRIANLILWFIIAHIMSHTLKADSSMPLSCGAFIGGVLSASVIALLKEFFPRLAEDLISAQYLNESSGNLVERFAGLWNDPNGYTVFVICAAFAALWLLNHRAISAFLFAVLTATLSVLGVLTLSKSCALLLIGFWVYFILSSRALTVHRKIVILLILGVLCVIGASFYQDQLTELIYRFTSAGGSGTDLDLSALTTHRSAIWGDYLKAVWQGDLFFGFGIDAPLVAGYACHNTYLQLLYEWGIFGIAAYLTTWCCVITGNKTEKLSLIPLLFLLVTVFFISCTYIEFTYFLLPFMLCTGGMSDYEAKAVPAAI